MEVFALISGLQVTNQPSRAQGLTSSTFAPATSNLTKNYTFLMLSDSGHLYVPGSAWKDISVCASLAVLTEYVPAWNFPTG